MFHPAPLELAGEAQNPLFGEARSAKTFTGEPVTDGQVRAIYELVKYGPQVWPQVWPQAR
ncbi:hypothetical protein Nans01_39650 [Nocardiopsis ansamitocini]|uniref:Uncharacterized protein n=1 Tax=Nocardiopsis ansamitocini TaxID=1670832 RepID=A0A9W6P9P8_9ACTN|nr:hypothetical protein Nans01_39650 [Nocardiopsis ansamitocini]